MKTFKPIVKIFTSVFIQSVVIMLISYVLAIFNQQFKDIMTKTVMKEYIRHKVEYILL